MQSEGAKPIIVSFHHPIDDKTVRVLRDTLGRAVNDGHDEVHLMLNTQGGSTAAGLSMYHFLRALTVNVVTYNIAIVQSIGNVLFLAGATRVCAPHSSFMIHGLSFKPESVWQKPQFFQQVFTSLNVDQDIFGRIIRERTRMTKEQVSLCFIQETYFTSAQALEYGITDRVEEISFPKGVPLLEILV